MMLLLFIALAVAAPAADFVPSLPGYGELPFKMWAGFLDGGVAPDPNAGRLNFHYMLLDAHEEVYASKKAEDVPTIFWSNGGPGAPSMYGLFVEIGPLLLNDLSLTTEEYRTTGVPSLVENPYAWTRLGRVLVVDNPPPVGLSYCSVPGQAAGGFSCGNWSDTLVAQAQANMMRSFYAAFPEYQPNPLYLTGESYAGVYTPTLFQKLSQIPSINLRGMAVGDGCLGNDVLCGGPNLDLGPPYWDIMFLFGHGQISIDAYDNLLSICPKEALLAKVQSPTCVKAVADVLEAVGMYQGYALYDNCQENTFKRRRSGYHPGAPHRLAPQHLSIAFPGMGYYCPGAALDEWLAIPAVKAALNVASDANFVSGDNGSDIHYDLNVDTVLPIWKNAILNGTFQLMTYEGDTDPSLSTFRTQAVWFPYMKTWTTVSQVWRPWTSDGKVNQLGYVQEWANGGMKYVTIRGSGHMVPEFRPEASFSMISIFINGDDYPKLNQ